MNTRDQNSSRYHHRFCAIPAALLLTLVAGCLLPLPLAAEESPTNQQIDLVTYRDHLGKAGTFMMVLTPSSATPESATSLTNSLEVDSKIEEVAIEEVEIEGVEVYAVTGSYQEQTSQRPMVVFGRYEEAGEARVTLRTRRNGRLFVQRETIVFPELANQYPVLERLWALARIEELEIARELGGLEPAAASAAIRDLVQTYQVVSPDSAVPDTSTLVSESVYPSQLPARDSRFDW